jgi:hypothetical protein
MSEAATSFWKSTKAFLPCPSGFPSETRKMLAGVDVDPRQGVLLIECGEQRGDRLARLSQRLLEAELAGHGADAVDTGLGPSGRGRDERKAGVVPLRAPAVVTIEMDRRRQATGAGHRIALDFGARSRDRVLLAVETHQVHAVDRAPPMSRAYAVADPHVDARGARARFPLRVDALARIGQHYAGPRLGEISGALIGVIVVCEDQHAPADGDRIAVEIGRNRRSREDSRKVVVAEHERAVDRTRRQHDALGAYAVQALAALAGDPLRGGQVICHLLDGLHEVHVLEREGARAREDAHIRQALKLGQDAVDPVSR